MYSELPQDIIEDILFRLPVKAVGRCRCVSKPWRYLLCRPEFIRNHLVRSRNLRHESLLLVLPQRGHYLPDSIYYASLSHPRHRSDKIMIISAKKVNCPMLGQNYACYGSCDGLLLVGRRYALFVFNPITNEAKEVHMYPSFHYHRSAVFGIGYDYVTDDYKIVTISYSLWADNLYVAVFSLKTGAWKMSERSPHNHVDGRFQGGVFVDGCIHWLCLTLNNEPTILAFDLAQDKFHEIALPSSTRYFNGLVTLGGCLCTFSQLNKVVWVMKEYGMQESWTKFTIDVQTIDFKPVCMLGKEQLVVLKNGNRELIIDNLIKRIEDGKIVKQIVVSGIPCGFVNKGSFIESLVSPHGMQ